MAQEHFDRLTALDASFLHQEGPTSHMHVGARARSSRGRRRRSRTCSTTSAAACTSCRATASGWRSRRCRPGGRCGSTTRASTSSTTCARPRCRAPGSEEQLLLLAGRLFSQQLDRSKPLWEMWIVEGLDGRPLRADLEDPPLAHRRRRRRGPRQVLFDLGPVPAELPAPRRGLGGPPRAVRRGARRPRRARRGAHRAAGRHARGRGRSPARPPRCARCAPRSRASARSPGPA